MCTHTKKLVIKRILLPFRIYTNYSNKKKERKCLVSKHSLHSLLLLLLHYGGIFSLTKPKYDTHQIIVIAVIYYFTILILSNIYILDIHSLYLRIPPIDGMRIPNRPLSFFCVSSKKYLSFLMRLELFQVT